VHILHVTEYCHAAGVGGTERYILDLIHGLNSLGAENVIGWLNGQSQRDAFDSNGVRIVPIPAPPMRVDAPLSELREVARRLLDSEKPDLLHFHTFGLTEALLGQLGKQRDIPYAFTYHSPAWTCRRGTLLLWGENPCDGEVRPWRCSACQSQERTGCGRAGGHFAALASLAVGWVTLPLSRNSLRRRTAFYYDTLRYRRVLRHFLHQCDLVVSCCDWSGPVLERNGARKETLLHCPQGVSNMFVSALSSQPISEGKGEYFTVGYIGRMTAIKGMHILMEGFSQTLGANARLRIVGWEPENAETPYSRQISELARRDKRINLIPRTGLAGTMAAYRKLDLLAIPSVCMETGPLTLMEALALGVPVYGSSRIGQLKLLQERGRIVEPNTPEGWRVALEEAYGLFQAGQWELERKRALGNGRPLRTMSEVAEEMASHYGKVASHAF
jgi:glycosyltransferase involved in cell wall biosynthesis